MPDRSTFLQRRCWADIVVLVAAVYLFLAAVGSPLELLSGGGGEAVADLEHLTALGPMSLGIPGIAMLLAAFFVGPMPTPEAEGKCRVISPELSTVLHNVSLHNVYYAK